MKPWRPYWKHLEEIRDFLLEDVGPRPFRRFSSVSSWIGRLPFTQLVGCDLIFRVMIDGLKYGRRLPHQVFEGDDIRWQMIMRVTCGLSFCQGEFGKRKVFDWTQPPEAIYKWLLIELWYLEAMRWAHVSFGSDVSKEQFAHHIQDDLFRRARPGRIESN